MTMLITGLGSVLTAVVDNYAWFVAARTITGIGIGADLAIVNTYINEMAPRHGRARYTALIFLFSALGAVLGILLGLWLTTPATPLPMGLPFAIAGPGFEYGWRIMYLIGGALALIGVLLCFQLPESARWLIARGRLQQAAAVIDMMEHRASAAYRWRPLSAPSSLVSATCKRPLHRDPRRPNVSRTHAARTSCVFFAGFTTILVSLHYPPPTAGLIAAVGTFGFVLRAVVAFAYVVFIECG